jgi:hypothetical protein
MTLRWDLEDWLTEIGDRIVRKAASIGTGSLSERERLVYEFWVFDTEQRNGGVSQYFCNRGLQQWKVLLYYASLYLDSFMPFATEVNRVVHSSPDAYKAVLNRGSHLDAQYEESCTRFVEKLKANMDQLE